MDDRPECLCYRYRIRVLPDVPAEVYAYCAILQTVIDKLEDFAFEFSGGEEKGVLSIVHKGKKLPGLRVIKEKTGWKVNER